MKIILLVIFSSFSLVYQATSTLGLDLSSALNTDTYKCFKKQGFSFVIPRAFQSYGQVDANANSNLKNAKNAGLSRDIYMFPCRGKNPDTQVDQLMKKVDSKLYNKVWIDVQTNPSAGCSWSTQSGPNNCKFMESIVKKIKSYKKPVGIYTNLNNWLNIIKDKNGCKSLGSLDLWYAHYDNIPNFKDFKPFGGWTKPFMKQFQGDVKVCGANIDKNFKVVSAPQLTTQGQEESVQQIDSNEEVNNQWEDVSEGDQSETDEEDEVDQGEQDERQEVDSLEEFDQQDAFGQGQDDQDQIDDNQDDSQE